MRSSSFFRSYDLRVQSSSLYSRLYSTYSTSTRNLSHGTLPFPVTSVTVPSVRLIPSTSLSSSTSRAYLSSSSSSSSSSAPQASVPSSSSSSSPKPVSTFSPSPSPSPSPSSSIITVTPFERICLTVGSAIAGFMDPSRGDMIAMLGELTAEPALRIMQQRMNQTIEGKEILQSKPRIRYTNTDIERLYRTLPKDSLGYTYAAYMRSHHFAAIERHEVRLISDPELAYVMQRYREIHDFVHTLSGLPPSVLGEIAVKWFEMVQTGLPMTALSSFVAPLRLSNSDKALLFQQYIPWAIKCGTEAQFLLSVKLEDKLDWPIDEVRRSLRFSPCIIAAKNYTKKVPAKK